MKGKTIIICIAILLFVSLVWGLSTSEFGEVLVNEAISFATGGNISHNGTHTLITG